MGRTRQSLSKTPRVYNTLINLWKNIEQLRREHNLTQEEFGRVNGFGTRQNYATYMRNKECPASCLYLIFVNYNVSIDSLFEDKISKSEAIQAKSEIPEQAQAKIDDLLDKIDLLMQVNESKSQIINMKNNWINELNRKYEETKRSEQILLLKIEELNSSK